MLTENVSSDASSKVQMGDSDVTLPESLRSSRWLAPAVHDDQPGTNDPRELRWSNEVGFSSCCQMMAGCNMVVSPSPAKLHMSRTSRLFDLIQTLRNHRFPVTGAHLAKELGISLRTLYRDIATLQAQGADIEGEPGLGYVLRPGFMLPPLMFTEEEIEALVLGSRWVSERADLQLSRAAKGALSKIAAVLPRELRTTLDSNSLMVSKGGQTEIEAIDLSQIRRAIRVEHKVLIQYVDLNGNGSERTIWPVTLGYFDHVRMLAGWCELRQAFRHFRTDRISTLTIKPERYPRRRQALLKEWREVDILQRRECLLRHST